MSKKRKRSSETKSRASRAPKPSPVPSEEKHFSLRDVLSADCLFAVALVPFVIARPLRDGMVYPTINFFYILGLGLLFAVWAVRLVVKGEAIRSGKPVFLLVCFVVVAGLTGLDSMDADGTVRALMLWCSYVFLFVLVTNGLRSRTALSIVLGAFAAVAFFESVFAVVHVKVLLPHMRKTVLDNPQLLLAYFGTAEPTVTQASRLNSNRAFGHFLFSNALAAFMILAVPLAVGGALEAWTRWRRLFREERCQPASPEHAFLTGALVWAVCIASSFLGYGYLHAQLYGGAPWHTHWLQWVCYVGLAPVLLGVLPGVFARCFGVMASWHATRGAFLTVLSATALWALGQTFSRGGALGLALSLVLTAGVVWLAFRRGKPKRGEKGRLARAAVMLLLTVGAMLCVGAVGGDKSAGGPQDRAAGQNDEGASDREIVVEGVSPSTDELMNPMTMRIRLGYWRCAFRMVGANFWTGVGLGNFAPAYPRYQDVKAWDVKHAHNDYIQVLCETGVLGFLAFCAVWGYFIVAGARRILTQVDAADRWLLAGLYGSVVAMLAHSLVDFDFYNPTLAFFEFLLAGAFWAWRTSSLPSAGGRVLSRAIGLVGLVVVLIVSVMAVQVRRFDLRMGSRNDSETRRNATAALLASLNSEEERPPVHPVLPLQKMFPSRQALEQVGTLIIRDAPDRVRPLGTDEPIPYGAYLLVRDRESTKRAVVRRIKARIAEIEEADAIYSLSADTGLFAFTWYDLLKDATRDPQERKQYVEQALKWAKLAVERSPEEGPCRLQYGRALWARGWSERGPDQLDYLRSAIGEMKKATELHPVLPHVWWFLGTKEKELGGIMQRHPTLAAEGKALATAGAEHMAWAEQLKKTKAGPENIQ